MKNLYFTILLLCSSFTFSQEEKEVQLSITLVANDHIADVNVDQDIFINSLTKYTDYCKTRFAELPVKQKVAILLVAHKSGPATYECYTNPVDKTIEESVEKDLSAFNLENTKLLDFPILFSINCFTKEEAEDFEGYKDPVDARMNTYSSADLKTKVELNKEFVINEVLPVLAAYELDVDDKFVGVKNLGQLVKNTDFSQKKDVIKMTDYNNDYWRATLEMEIGNQMIPVTKIAMLMSQGEFDYAMRYIEIVTMFSNRKSTADRILRDLTVRLDIFYEELNAKMALGLAEHDKGNYDKAMVIYNEILAAHPNSAWALYERYFSDNAMKVANKQKELGDIANWYIIRPEIYSHNPVYDVDVHSETGKQAYLIMRRQELKELFKTKEERLNDVYKYAEIATDLDAPGLAAQFFWLTATYDKEKMQESINNFLYCLNKLGNTEIKANFKGDFDKVFKKIDAQKEKEMTSNSFYKLMEKSK